MTEITDTSFYNMASAGKLGWEPDWFGVEGFGRDLEEAVKQFQRESNLTVDGLCGPMTFARIYTQRESELHEKTYIIVDENVKLEIDWPKVDTETLRLPSTNYREVHGNRKITEIVTHWDATLSAKYCYNILKKKGISTHFCIDNDGTIYQMVDPKHKAWHAKGHNGHTIGIDLSNAYYLKYNKTYQRSGFGPRPILNSTLHGRDLGEHLGYYPEQLKAYKELLKVLTEYFDIKLKAPMVDGKLCDTVYEPAVEKKFNGIVSHYHLTTNKIDCAGLEIDKIIEEIKEEIK